jgi:hypothetical protein
MANANAHVSVRTSRPSYKYRRSPQYHESARTARLHTRTRARDPMHGTHTLCAAPYPGREGERDGACRREKERERSIAADQHAYACVRVRYDEQKMHVCTDVYVLERCACNHICPHNMSQERARKRETFIGPNRMRACMFVRVLCAWLNASVRALVCRRDTRGSELHVRACARMRPRVCACA